MVISRTINHDWSYLSSSPIVSNRTLTHTTNRDERLQMDIVGSINDWSYNQSEQLVTGRTTDRATVWRTITHDWWCDHMRLVVRSCETCLRLVIADNFEHDRRPCCDWFCSYDHPQPLRSVARSLYDLTAIPKCFYRNLVVGLVWLWQS